MNRKKSQSIDRQSHHIIGYQKLNKLKELGFTTSWNVNEKKRQYNALEDPNADRYFKYQSVKLHMKQLKKSLSRAEKSDAEKKKLTKLIKQKLSDHLPAIKVAASTYNIQATDLNKSQARQNLSKQKSSKNLIKQKSLTVFGKHHKKNKSKKKKHDTEKYSNVDFSIEKTVQLSNVERDSAIDSKDNEDICKAHTQVMNPIKKSLKSLRADDQKQAQRKQYLKKQQDLLHRKKHEEFISYIAKKRQTLESANK